MLLGIGLHAAIPFVPWRDDDETGVWLLDVFVGFVHGFRMPLFFIVSGFFTAMLWRRRGLRSLIRHRLRRVGLPLMIGCFTIIPAVWIGIISGWVISGEVTWEQLESGEGVGAYEAALEEDLEAAGGDDAADRAGVDADATDPAGGDDAADRAGVDADAADRAGVDADAADRAGVDADATDRAGVDADAKSEPRAGAEEKGEEGIGFAHLWFLWVLLWQVAGFAAVVWWVRRRARRRGVERRLSERAASRILWSLPVLSVLPQLAMVEGGFGPDTSEGLIPAPQVLLYYACFFGFGALAYDHRGRGGEPLMDVIGRRWVIQLAVGTVVLFPAGLTLLEGLWSASALLQIVFAWTMSFGLVGLFRRFMSGARFRVRYLSDASYWMYLAHLPLVFVAQGVVARLGLPALVDFAVMCVAVTAMLLVTYRYVVRYTFVGRLLNGRRTRAADQASKAALAATGSSGTRS